MFAQGIFQIADTLESGSPAFLLQAEATEGSQDPRIYLGGTGFESGASTTFVAGVPEAIGFSYSGATHSLYQNGKNLLATATTISAGETSNWWLGTGYAGEFDASYLLCLQWNRYLRAEEHVSLAANPYQMFRRAPRRVWRVPSPGAAAAKIDVFVFGAMN